MAQFRRGACMFVHQVPETNRHHIDICNLGDLSYCSRTDHMCQELLGIRQHLAEWKIFTYICASIKLLAFTKKCKNTIIFNASAQETK